jgi:pSer/pThr/pTyr-binding forkhead associated (FHA) protein
MVIGRDASCDVVVNDEYASPRHCQLFTDRSGQAWVRDLGSTNGTRVVHDGQTFPARPTAVLRPGDVLIVGRTRIPWTP